MSKIISFSFLFLIIISIFLPFNKIEAIEQSIKLERVGCTLNGQKNKWSFGFKITTTNIANSTKIYDYLYKGGTPVLEGNKTSIVQNNYTEYLTGDILDTETTYTIKVTVAGIQNLTASYTEKTPNEGSQPPCGQPGPPVEITNTQTTPEGGGTTKTDYTLLAPLPLLDKTIDTKPSAENPCPFGTYLNIIIKLFFGICGVLAVVMIVWGGIQYMTSELVSSKEAGKESIRNAILGLLLGFGAWLILNTINPDLLSVCLDTLPTAEITITPGDNTPQTPIDGKFCKNTIGGPYEDKAVWATLAGVPATLPSNVTPNNAECEKVGDKNCTSLRGLNLSKIEALSTNCPACIIKLNAGTECWAHGGASQKTTHRPLSATVDFDDTPSVNKFFTGSESFPVVKKDYSGQGIACTAEPKSATSSGPHWHCEGTGGAGTAEGEKYKDASFTASSKTIFMKIDKYDTQKVHKVMITNSTPLFSLTINPVLESTLIINGTSRTIPVTLSQTDYDKIKNITVNASVFSAGKGLGTKSVLIN